MPVPLSRISPALGASMLIIAIPVRLPVAMVRAGQQWGRRTHSSGPNVGRNIWPDHSGFGPVDAMTGAAVMAVIFWWIFKAIFVLI